MRLLTGIVMVCAVFATGAVPTATAQPTTPPVPVPETFAGTPALMFADEPTIIDAQPMQPQAWSRTTDARMVRLHFTTGTPECYGVSATVEETWTSARQPASSPASSAYAPRIVPRCGAPKRASAARSASG